MIEFIMALAVPVAAGTLAIWLLLVVSAWWKNSRRRR